MPWRDDRSSSPFPHLPDVFFAQHRTAHAPASRHPSTLRVTSRLACLSLSRLRRTFLRSPTEKEMAVAVLVRKKRKSLARVHSLRCVDCSFITATRARCSNRSGAARSTRRTYPLVRIVMGIRDERTPSATPYARADDANVRQSNACLSASRVARFAPAARERLSGAAVLGRLRREP